jgi:hypothetical protein
MIASVAQWCRNCILEIDELVVRPNDRTRNAAHRAKCDDVLEVGGVQVLEVRSGPFWCPGKVDDERVVPTEVDLGDLGLLVGSGL